MKTDRELLELAAKAAGIDAGWHCPADEIEYQADNLAKSEGMWLKGSRSPDNSKYWNPLIDDGDAFRLAVKLCMEIYSDDEATHCGSAYARVVGTGDDYVFDPIVSDAYAATRRAIVRAAAEVGSGMP